MSIESSFCRWIYGNNLNKKEVEFMREVTITFTLYDEHEERLKKIVEEYKKQHNFEQIEDKMFEMIMLTGSKHDIDAKLKFHEWKLGLREDYK